MAVFSFESAEHTGIVAAAVVGVLAVARAIYRLAIKPTYDLTVGDKLDLLTTLLAVLAEDTARQIAKIDEQLHTNGGSSLRDQTMRIEATVIRNETALTEHKRDAQTHFRAIHSDVSAANRRIDMLLSPDGLRRVTDCPEDEKD